MGNPQYNLMIEHVHQLIGNSTRKFDLRTVIETTISLSGASYWQWILTYKIIIILSNIYLDTVDIWLLHCITHYAYFQ